MTGVAKKDEPAATPDAAVDDSMLVQLTVGQLRKIMRDEVERVLERASEAKPPVKSSKWVDAADAAEYFRVTPQTIRNWCKDGAPHRTFGTGKTPVYRIDLATFEPWVEHHHRGQSQGSR